MITVMRRSIISFAAALAIITLTRCSRPQPSIVGKWAGWMTATCPRPGMLPGNYRPLTISLDLTADGQCTNVHGSGIGADITVHGVYELRDSLFLYMTDWGTDTLWMEKFTDTELVLRRAPYENGCVRYLTMTRELADMTTP
jgi:hypothetical protein